MTKLSSIVAPGGARPWRSIAVATAALLLLTGSAEPEPVSRVADVEVSVAPDGMRLAFISNREGRSRLYVMHADGSEVRRVTSGEGSEDSPAWSPDGRWIAFVSERAGGSDIHVISADGSVRRRVTEAPGADLHPSWSPDGRRLLFTRLLNRADPDDPRLEIHVVNIDGSEERRLTAGPVSSFASWSPDGSRMVYWRMFDGNADIVIADSEARLLTRLTSDPAFEGWPAWSPDGTHIAFTRERGEEADIHVADLAGRSWLVAGGPGRKTGPRWSADGRSIFYARQHERQARIWRIAWNPENPTRVPGSSQ